MKLPKILVTNDDGIDSQGIYNLVLSLKLIGDVIVVAPDSQQSAVGHALSVEKPLRVTTFHRNDTMFGYAVNGTPADSVKLALASLLDEKPDLIVSGINHGRNTAINVLYSGTVSAATEGMLVGIPSIAVSLDSHNRDADTSVAARYARMIAESALDGLPDSTLLNINVPNIPEDSINGVRVTRLSRNIWKDAYEKRVDPFGREYFWFAGDFETFDQGPDTDETAIKEGYVSVTPVSFNFTNTGAIEELKKMEDIKLVD